MILVLDTTDASTLRMGMCTERGDLSAEEVFRSRSAERLDGPALVLQFIKKHGGLNHVRGILVRDAAGTFSGVRLGIAIANSIVLARNISVVTVHNADNHSTLADIVRDGMHTLAATPSGRYAVPQYHTSPNISTPKKRTPRMQAR